MNARSISTRGASTRRAPAAATRWPSRFPEPLDHGLLQRALAIADGRGRRIDGEVRIEAHETRWVFTPAAAWRSGDYFLQAMTILEDMAGNRIGRAFEVDEFSRADESSAQETVVVPFRVE